MVISKRRLITINQKIKKEKNHLRLIRGKEKIKLKEVLKNKIKTENKIRLKIKVIKKKDKRDRKKLNGEKERKMK